MKKCLYCKSILLNIQFNKKNSLVCKNCLKNNKKDIEKRCIVYEDFGIYYSEDQKDQKICCLL